MILVDLQQTAIANFLMYHKTGKLGSGSEMLKEEGFGENMNDKSDIELMRFMLLMALRSYKKQFSEKYGDIVLCCDSAMSWRRDIFPFYKIKRKKARDNSVFDWVTFNSIFAKVKEEFRENLPYRLIEAEGAEGDDVIAVMCEMNASRQTPEQILIYSSDQDFLQLQRFPLVQQYDKYRQRFLVTQDPLASLKEKIIRGDKEDGVPNIMSADNVFAAGVRQTPIMTKKCEEWLKIDPLFFCTPEMLERYKRNETLVDLSKIPLEIKSRIATAYLTKHPAPRSKLYQYLLNTRSVEMINSIGEF